MTLTESELKQLWMYTAAKPGFYKSEVILNWGFGPTEPSPVASPGSPLQGCTDEIKPDVRGRNSAIALKRTFCMCRGEGSKGLEQIEKTSFSGKMAEK